MESIVLFEDYLNYYLSTKKEKNNRYSLRSLAKTVCLEPSMLSKILRKKYRLNDALIKKIGLKLDLDPQKIEHFCIQNKKIIDHLKFSKIDNESLSQLSNWESAVILRSFDLSSHWDNEELAIKLDCSVEKIEKILDVLIKNDLIKKTSQNKYIRTKHQYMVKNEKDNFQINKELTKGFILKAHESVEKNKIENRVHVNAISTMNQKTYNLILPKIHQLILEISRLAEEDTSKEDRVMVFNLNFFPILRK